MTRAAIVLVHPEIAGNTGSVGRTCVALDLDLCLIKPYGFEITDRNVRRAGLDYWKHVRLHEYDSWEDFLTSRQPAPSSLYLFEEYGAQSFYDVTYAADFHLVFGQETVGLGDNVLKGREDRLVKLPMRSPHIRSLNLANAATAAAYQALRGVL